MKDKSMDWNHIVFFYLPQAKYINSDSVCVHMWPLISPLQEQHLLSKHTNNFDSTYITQNFPD